MTQWLRLTQFEEVDIDIMTTAGAALWQPMVCLVFETNMVGMSRAILAIPSMAFSDFVLTQDFKP